MPSQKKITIGQSQMRSNMVGGGVGDNIVNFGSYFMVSTTDDANPRLQLLVSNLSTGTSIGIRGGTTVNVFDLGPAPSP